MATSSSPTSKKKRASTPARKAAAKAEPTDAPEGATKKKSARAAVGAARAKAPATRRRATADDGAATPAAKKSREGAGGVPRSLVIVESPTKSRTLTKFLGRGFTVMASNGHIMDLPKSKLGVDLDNDFEPEYVPIRSKTQALAKIKTAARDADRIFLAPDPDREGEAIAWHLATELKAAHRPLQRLTFNEITERAVRQALDHPRDLDMNLVNAQQARRVLDRLVGYKVSLFVWRTVRYGLSAGRVQSVALRLICEREEAILAFVAEEYWTLEVDYETPSAERFTARLLRIGDDALEQGQIQGEGAGGRAIAIAEELATAEARIESVETTPRQVHPRAPFITSTLQQTAYNRYGYTSSRTMKIAQQLYEGIKLGDQGSVGLITYMRTDAPRLADEAITEIREWLARSLGAEYVPESPRQYKSRKSAQEAHEAIRPTSVERTPEQLRGHLTEEQWRLYDLIWKRAVASQTASAEYLATTVEVISGRYGLRATGRILKFPGFQKLYGIDEDDDAAESSLPELTEGTTLTVSREPLVKEKPVAEPVTETETSGNGAPTDAESGAGARGRHRPRDRGRCGAPRTALHPAAAALHRGLAGQDARGGEHRAAEHLRHHRHHDHVARLRQPRQGSAQAHRSRHGGQPTPDRDLPRRVQRQVHRRDGGGARRDRGGKAGVAPGDPRLLGSVQQGSRAGREAEQAPSQEGRGDHRHRVSHLRAHAGQEVRPPRSVPRLPGVPRVQVHAAGRRRRAAGAGPRRVRAVRIAAGGAQTARSGGSSTARAGPTASSPSRSRSASPAPSAARARSRSGGRSAARSSSAARAIPSAPSRCGTDRGPRHAPTAARRSWSRRKPRRKGSRCAASSASRASSPKPSVREALERFLTELSAQRRASTHTVAAYRRDVTRALDLAAPGDARFRPRAGAASCSS